MQHKVLFVDDEVAVLNGFKRLIRTGFELHFAESGQQAIDKIKADGEFAVIVSDMRMPSMTGIELLESVAELSPDTVRVMLTGNSDQQVAVDAVNIGRIFRFLSKPCQIDQIVSVLTLACQQHDLISAERVLMEQTLFGVVKLLIDVLNGIYPLRAARSRDLAGVVKKYAAKLQGRAWLIEMAALLSEVGWLTLPHELVERFEAGVDLSPEERPLIDGVQGAATNMLHGIPRLSELASIMAPLSEKSSREAQIFSLLKGCVDYSRQQKCSLKKAIDLSDWKFIDMSLVALLRSLAADDSDTSGDVIAGKEVSLPAVRLLRAGDRMLEDCFFEDGTLAVGNDVVLTPFMTTRLINLSELRRVKVPIRVMRGERHLARASTSETLQ